MADSKSAGRMAVWVRVPLRVQGRLGALTGSAVRPRAGLCCGERALFGCGCCQVPQGSFGFFGEGRHVLFHVCGWCRRLWGPRLRGVAGVII